jgi:hypothetical protein
MRYLAQVKHWTLAQIQKVYPDYSLEMIERITAKPYQAPKPLKTCRRCGVGMIGQRSTKTYCSDLRRVAAYRETPSRDMQ